MSTVSTKVLQIDSNSSRTDTTEGPARQIRPISDLSPEERADEYGDLNLKCEQFRSTYDRRDALRDAIQSQYENHPADQSAWLEGLRWKIEVKPRINQDRIVDIAKLRRAMETKAFWAIVTNALNRALGQIKDAVGKAKYATLVTTERTAYRKLVAIAKSPPVAA